MGDTDQPKGTQRLKRCLSMPTMGMRPEIEPRGSMYISVGAAILILILLIIFVF